MTDHLLACFHLALHPPLQSQSQTKKTQGKACVYECACTISPLSGAREAEALVRLKKDQVSLILAVQLQH